MEDHAFPQVARAGLGTSSTLSTMVGFAPSLETGAGLGPEGPLQVEGPYSNSFAPLKGKRINNGFRRSIPQNSSTSSCIIQLNTLLHNLYTV